MKILIVVDNDLNGDIRVLREIGILKEQGFEVSVLCFGFRKNYPDPLPGVQIQRISINRKLKNILFFFLNTIPVYEWLWTSAIRKFIKTKSLDFLHVHDLYMAKAAGNAIRKSTRKIPLILDLHENYPFTILTYNWTKGFLRRMLSQPKLWKKKERRYLGYAVKIIVLSTTYRDDLTKKYPEFSGRFIVFPNVPDIRRPEYSDVKAAADPFVNNYPILFYYGVIAERRGIFDTLEVLTSLLKDNINVNLLLIGPVDKKDRPRFMEMISSDTLKGCVHYIPWINSSEFPSYLKISDICLAPFHVNPQHESGIANKIFDYMLGEKPLIVSACKPQKELVEKYSCGLVFSNMEQFRDAVITLAGNKALRRDMGRNGRIAILTDYNSDIYRENLISAFIN